MAKQTRELYRAAPSSYDDKRSVLNNLMMPNPIAPRRKSKTSEPAPDGHQKSPKKCEGKLLGNFPEGMSGSENESNEDEGHEEDAAMAIEGEDEGHEEDEAMTIEGEDIFGEAPKTKKEA